MLGAMLKMAQGWAGTAIAGLGLGGMGFWLPIALAVLPAGVTWVKLKIDHAAAIEKIKGDAAIACNARVAEIERRINEAVADRERAAREAADAVVDITTPDEIAEACAREVSCIAHNEFKSRRSKK